MVRNCCLLWGLVMVLAPTAQAEKNRSWDQLMQNVKAGKKVVVTRMDGTKAEGKLLDISPDFIKVRTGMVHKKDTEISRRDVLRVRKADLRRRNTLIGLALGIGIGAAAGASNNEVYGLAAVAAGAGAGIGAAVGSLMPLGNPLYESPRNRTIAARAEAEPAQK